MILFAIGLFVGASIGFILAAILAINKNRKKVDFPMRGMRDNPSSPNLCPASLPSKTEKPG